MKRFTTLFAAFILLTSCIKDGSETPNEVINHVDVGDAVPGFTVSDSEGNTFNSDAFTGKRSLLVLFETTCGDCRKVLPLINDDVWGAIKDNQDYRLVTISRGEEAAVVDAYWKDNNYTMPKYLDPGRAVFNKFANSTIPRIYIINEKGIIEWKTIEKLEISTTELIKLLKQQEAE